jgi:SAM-dependent methyltransferase
MQQVTARDRLELLPYLSRLRCPYDAMSVHLQGLALKCSACERYFPWNGFAFDLRPDELRAGRSRWSPGPQHWDAGWLRIFGFGRRARNSPREANCEILDIGCGSRPTGSINVDAYMPEPLPPNFILASAERLPFAAKSFDVVRSRYVIEHLTEPTSFIRDCLRLARSEVEIVTDNGDWLGEIAFRLLGRGRIFHPEHVYKWSAEYLLNLCKRIDADVAADVTLLTLSNTLPVKALSLLGRGPILGALFHRDICVRLRHRVY